MTGQNPVVWFEIYVQDMKRAKTFYQTVLDVSLQSLQDPTGEDGLEMWAFGMGEQATGAAGALVKAAGVTSGGNSTLVYFGCNDCSVEEGRIVAAGGRVERSKMSIGPFGFISLGIDTEGNMFGLHSQQ